MSMKLPILTAMLIGGVALHAQTDAPRASQPYRAGVEVVDLDVRVLDDRGKPVTGLTRDDFELFEDGTRQSIQVFTPVDIPFIPGPPVGRTVVSDVASNRHPFDGRLYVFVLDDLHTHPLRAHLVKKAVRQFLDERFSENDRAAIVVTSGINSATQEITGNRAALLDTLDRFQGQKLRSSVMERIDGYFRQKEFGDVDTSHDTYRTRGNLDPLDMERGHQARMALERLASISKWLRTVPARRKAVVFISEGIDYDIRDVFANRSASSVITATREAIAEATRSNVSIYAVDPRGLTGFAEDAIELGSVPDDPKVDLGTAALNREVELGHDSLRVLAEDTGGFALINTNDLNGGFERLVRENSSYYVLGYQPGSNRHDGTFRKIDVRVRRPGVRVVARRGYVAPSRHDKAVPLLAAGVSLNINALLASPIPISGLPIDGGATVFRGANGQGSVLITAELHPTLPAPSTGAPQPTRLEVGTVAVASDGKTIRGDHRAITLTPKPDVWPALTNHGYRTMSRLDLPPGKYQIRLAARETSTERGGSVLLDVVVPDFSKTPVSVSQPVLGTNAADQAVTGKPDPDILKVLPVPPTVAREFDERDTLAVLAEVYDTRKAPGSVSVHSTIATTDGKTLVETEETVKAEAFDASRRAYAHRLTVPLNQLGPGRYVVRIGVRSQAAQNTVTREVAFVVRRSKPTA